MTSRHLLGKRKRANCKGVLPNCNTIRNPSPSDYGMDLYNHEKSIIHGRTELSTNDNMSTFRETSTAFLTLWRLISEKDYNELLSVMKEDCDTLPKFLRQFDTLQKIQNGNWIVDDTKFDLNCFEKHILETLSGHSCCLYVRALSAALRKQVNSV